MPSQGAGGSQSRPIPNGRNLNSRFNPKNAGNSSSENFGISSPSRNKQGFSRMSVGDNMDSSGFYPFGNPFRFPDNTSFNDCPFPFRIACILKLPTMFEDPFELPDGRSFHDDIFASRNSGVGGRWNSPKKCPPVVKALPCCLEELYWGTTKKMKISRNDIDRSGRHRCVEEILTIEIKAGWKKGTKITFPEKGDEQKGVTPSDIVFVIEEKPHAVFERDGNDLLIIRDIALLEGMAHYNAQVRTGCKVQVATLDGRKLTIPIGNVTGPTHEQVVKGEGTPISNCPSRKGDLRIKFTS